MNKKINPLTLSLLILFFLSTSSGGAPLFVGLQQSALEAEIRNFAGPTTPLMIIPTEDGFGATVFSTGDSPAIPGQLLTREIDVRFSSQRDGHRLVEATHIPINGAVRIRNSGKQLRLEFTGPFRNYVVNSLEANGDPLSDVKLEVYFRLHESPNRGFYLRTGPGGQDLDDFLGMGSLKKAWFNCGQWLVRKRGS